MIDSEMIKSIFFCVKILHKPEPNNHLA